MHSEPVSASRAAVRGRRRKRDKGSAEGPVFVDSTGRRARLLRRLGLLLGAVCLGYTAVLGLAFMGVGISVNPSSLLPFGAGGGGGPEGGPGPGGGTRPQGGGAAPTDVPPTPVPSASSSAVPSTAPSAAPSTAPSADPTSALTDRPDAPTP
ncbi:hypothetical protein [Streptomyces sp. enrichment culture]|uniref:hypothetical protein n=1 Tax=Streptomyces sp. enrichment culture TaxID=1795815 RepID=UPI003F56B35B